MQKANGSNRTVYIGEDSVCKVPRIYKKTIVNIIKDIIFRGRITKGNQIFFRTLIKPGFTANNNERIISKNSEDNQVGIIIAKVKFSIPYILNIQEKCQVIKNLRGNFLSDDIKLCVPDRKLYYKEGHTFANRDNYGIIDGKIVILDYGGDYMKEIFEKYGVQIKNWFERSSFYYIKIEMHWNLLQEEQRKEVIQILNKIFHSLDEKLEALIEAYNKYFAKYE